jgi:predicted enzyme related to lactoylglutathione lyase
MQNNPVVWFEIYVKDMQRAARFYESVLAIKLENLDSPAPGMMQMMSFPSLKDGFGATGALAKMKDGPSGGNSVIVYFSCKDCSVEAGRVAANGGKVIKKKFSIGEYGSIALVEDTEGNTVGLHSMNE